MEVILDQHTHRVRTLADLLVDLLYRLRTAHDRIADLERDRDVYQEIARAGIEALHHVTTERDALRRSNYRLHEERRRPLEQGQAA